MKTVTIKSACLTAAMAFIFTSCVSMRSTFPPGHIDVAPKKASAAAASESVTIAENEDVKPAATPSSGWHPDDYEENGEEKILIINVLINKFSSPFTLSSDSDIIIKESGKNLGRSCEIKSIAGAVAINGDATRFTSAELTSASVISLAGKKYRGSFIVHAESEKILAVNRLSIEEYLYGVLPSEILPSWHAEVLKSQAVAARSFAFYNKLNSKDNRYDLDSTVISQVYKGFGVEHKNTNAAVDATRGLIMTYNSDVVQAFFHANSGGKTADCKEVWGGSLPYLKVVDDYYCKDGKHYSWKYTVSLSSLEEKLEKSGNSTGEIFDITVPERSESGRALMVKINTSSGTVFIKGNQFRTALGVDALRSTNFNVRIEGKEAVFNGLGWGHGVGLSQEGAAGMAEKGYPYKDILKFYYKGVNIKKAVLK
ncbi:MAG: Amidase enhancer precursor [Candidatus Aerophobetes bacterium ADurb.Bin490]|nr:MAG: Amidase enhancer precursor [Candidatus Aerophobetes bacterium ADurb.Bin490]HPI03332.1 SpoIID/LytB domain-containing protein [Candidatus Goldiibacteriota bacterium]HPN64640.1 SpoIID/LytB domain-containing protein [Candidatus Goldiibacteriota bacterium]HRQ43705.1 SpoIID/LytB domain-containing protein [Candidatus Goldiibacteriota bacterium]